ncbi:hypothetical protein NNO04_20630 [Citrobacter sp. Awk 4]|uniref:hypothetical protein n=1 Tax=Citrobacter sp. Awk 4 TaxID=2963955 RepID=UPI0023023B02|nr:hypothetical protein [Citrobacter sp. Awk 4]MDA8481081.1 hypothetical protein [Citrobacter sp. Awk 4]
MHRIDTATAQKDKFGAGKNGFTRGNPQTGTPATDLDDDYFDMLQEELVGVVEASGATLDKEKRDQLLTALKKLLLSRSNPFGDIKADGAAAIATALANLGLGAAAKLGAPEFTFSGYSFIAKFPGKNSGNDSTLIIQGTRVTIPQASSGSISTTDVTWPTAFPNSCNFAMISSGGTTFSPNNSPFFGVAPGDRTKCTASSTYTASSAAAFVLGVGY